MSNMGNNGFLVKMPLGYFYQKGENGNWEKYVPNKDDATRFSSFDEAEAVAKQLSKNTKQRHSVYPL